MDQEAPLVTGGRGPLQSKAWTGWQQPKDNETTIKAMRTLQITRVILGILAVVGAFTFMWLARRKELEKLEELQASSGPGGSYYRYDCELGKNWTEDKKDWCCWNQDQGCNPNVKGPFFCKIGYDKWKTEWSAEKKRWCCEKEEKACPEVQETQSWPCDEASPLIHTLAAEERNYCCHRFGSLCPNRALNLNCSTGIEKWESGWSGTKQQWCCKFENVTCPSQRVKPDLPAQPVAEASF